MTKLPIITSILEPSISDRTQNDHQKGCISRILEVPWHLQSIRGPEAAVAWRSFSRLPHLGSCVPCSGCDARGTGEQSAKAGLGHAKDRHPWNWDLVSPRRRQISRQHGEAVRHVLAGQ